MRLPTTVSSPAHPRLFADAARFQTLARQTDEVSLQLVALLRSEAESYLNAEAVVYPPDGFLFGPMREVQGRVVTLSMMFRLTGERRYFEKAREELLHLSALPEWRPVHYGVLLQQAGQQLELRITASAPWTVDIEDVSQPRKPQDSPNPGLWRIVIRLQTAANRSKELRVSTFLVG